MNMYRSFTYLHRTRGQPCLPCGCQSLFDIFCLVWSCICSIPQETNICRPYSTWLNDDKLLQTGSWCWTDRWCPTQTSVCHWTRYKGVPASSCSLFRFVPFLLLAWHSLVGNDSFNFWHLFLSATAVQIGTIYLDVRFHKWGRVNQSGLCSIWALEEVVVKRCSNGKKKKSDRRLLACSHIGCMKSSCMPRFPCKSGWMVEGAPLVLPTHTPIVVVPAFSTPCPLPGIPYWHGVESPPPVEKNFYKTEWKECFGRLSDLVWTPGVLACTAAGCATLLPDDIHTAPNVTLQDHAFSPLLMPLMTPSSSLMTLAGWFHLIFLKNFLLFHNVKDITSFNLGWWWWQCLPNQ